MNVGLGKVHDRVKFPVAGRSGQLLAAVCLLLVSGCAGTPGGQTLQDSLSADPALRSTTRQPTPTATATTSAPPAETTATATPTPTPEPTTRSSPSIEAVTLPDDFPNQLPIYPNATLTAVTPTGGVTTSEAQDAKNPNTDQSIELSSNPGADTQDQLNQADQPDQNDQTGKTENTALPDSPTTTTWTSTDPFDAVQEFYKLGVRRSSWQLVKREIAYQKTSFEIVGHGVTVTIAIEAQTASTDQPTNEVTSSSTAQPMANQPTDEKAQEPTQEQKTSEQTDSKSSSTTSKTQWTITYTPLDASDSINQASETRGDRPASVPTIPANQLPNNLNQVPEPLKSSVEEVLKLGVIEWTQTSTANTSGNRSNTPAGSTPTDNSLSSRSSASSSQTFNPDQVVTRREYARWLLAVYNRFYDDRAAAQIRPAPASSAPAFQDVPSSDPDFATIQGLAEAGILPSTLNGNATTTQFRPDDPLTREVMLLWKVPLDFRRSLPTATIEAVQETWGFQDTARVEPLALRSLLADFQNGDLANIRRTFGYTTLLQPKKPVTQAEAIASLWYFGFQGEGRSAKSVVSSSSQSSQTSHP